MNGKMMNGKLQIELPEEVAEGIYANLVAIAHSPSEFVLDFVRAVPGVPKAKVQTRVIMTPINAKGLMKALEDNIKKYESKFGEIKVGEKSQGKTIGFSTEE
ncbi:DUF3467 domain-containing protein [bacterium]|nr:DUF3467 domain-containing protein [bacterium]